MTSPPPTPPPPTIIVRATVAEAAGALKVVAGLPVLLRSLRQLARKGGTKLILATDTSFPLPADLPATVTVHRLEGDAQAAFDALVAQTGGLVVPGDVVRVGKDPLDGGLRVVDDTTCGLAEDRIFADLLRGDLGIVARHLNKKISFRITRHVLCHLPVTPNQVTLGAAVIGLIGCVIIASGGYFAIVAGLLLAQLQSILDGCDGELARVRFQQSRIGEWLDTLVDDFMNLCLVGSLTVGIARGSGSTLAAVVGGTAFCMFLFYNVISYRELLRQGVGGELINIRWRLTSGKNMKSMVTDSSSGGFTHFVLSLGRRDTFVLGWLLFASLGIPGMNLLWALLAAGPCFAAALYQAVTRDPAPPASPA
ncbi:MAG TPA: CDP-alcohol phosphatidyltransferase family protein [Polyangia bacterium]|nr:CDP-alcohol phosphatidyltransferase family protein [Polyangia bacterium]